MGLFSTCVLESFYWWKNYCNILTSKIKMMKGNTSLNLKFLMCILISIPHGPLLCAWKLMGKRITLYPKLQGVKCVWPISQSCFFISKTPHKPMHEICWTFVGNKTHYVDVHIIKEFRFHYFSGNFDPEFSLFYPTPPPFPKLKLSCIRRNMNIFIFINQYDTDLK